MSTVLYYEVVCCEIRNLESIDQKWENKIIVIILVDCNWMTQINLKELVVK